MSTAAGDRENLADLVEKAKGGDLEAFERLVAHYQDRVYNYVLRMVHDPVEAQDVAQETFLRAYQGLPRFRGASSFQTWLYRIASNLAIDAARTRKRRGVGLVSIDEPLEQEDDMEMGRDLADESGHGPLDEAMRQELQREVWRAVGELSDRLRPVVVLSDLQGLSYQEVADILGCPVGTVKSRLFNARNQLREKLRDRLAPEPMVVGGTESA